MSSIDIDHVEYINGMNVGVIYSDEFPSMYVELGNDGEVVSMTYDEELEIDHVEEIDGQRVGVIYSDELPGMRIALDEDGNIASVKYAGVYDDQYGGGQSFVMMNVKERNIPKFNVKGKEFQLKIHRLDNVTYLEAVQLLHNTLRGK